MRGNVDRRGERPAMWPLVAVLVAFSMVVAACGDSDDTTSAPTDTTPAGPSVTGAQSAEGETEADAGAEGEPQRGGTLRVAQALNPTSLDPITGGSGGDHVSLYPMYATLVDFDKETMAPIPGLAESWEFTEDPATLVLTLRPGVVFHDGTPMNAEAVKYNLDRTRELERSTIKNDLASVESVEVLSDLEVQLNLVRMDAALPLILADRAGMMVSPTAAEQFGADFDANPVGAGQFRFVEWAPGDRLVMERFEDYWEEDLPYLDGMTFRYMEDVQTQINALVTDQIDFIMAIDPADYERVEREQGIEVAQGSTLAFDNVYFNMAEPPFDDPRVRLAFSLAIDREAMLEALNFGIGEVGWQPVPSSHWAYQPDLSPTFPHDVERAKELLAEAGYPDGVAVRGLAYSGERQVRKAQIVQQMVAEAGFDMPFEVLEVGVAVEEFYEKGAYQVFPSGWSGRPDPNTTYTNLFTNDSFFVVGDTGVTGVEEMLAATAGVADTEDRAPLFEPLTKVVMENAINIPLIYGASISAFRDDVRGYVPNLLGKPKLDTVWISQ